MLMHDASGKQPFLHKHGNGRILRGIDEGLHTMHVGSKRRLIIPQSLGYNEFGLGPYPLEPSRRKRLGNVLDYLDKNEGQLVVDVELAMVRLYVSSIFSPFACHVIDLMAVVCTHIKPVFPSLGRRRRE
jgi:FKBP-type peptidyl-prolyl cis-trans isomerase